MNATERAEVERIAELARGLPGANAMEISGCCRRLLAAGRPAPSPPGDGPKAGRYPCPDGTRPPFGVLPYGGGDCVVVAARDRPIRVVEAGSTLAITIYPGQEAAVFVPFDWRALEFKAE